MIDFIMIYLRPHHFLCTYNFIGLGYSENFITNYKNINLRIKNGEQIKVINSLDDICSPCPWNNLVSCSQQTKINKLDASHAKFLNLSIGDIVHWEDISNKIDKKITILSLKKICKFVRDVNGKILVCKSWGKSRFKLTFKSSLIIY